MGKKNKKTPSQIAAEQAALNRQAYLDTLRGNQVGQVTPYGSLTYSGTIGAGDRVATQTLSPEIQALTDSQLQTAQGLTDAANTRLQQLTSEPFDIGDAGGRRIDLDSTDRFGRPMIRRTEQRPLTGSFDSGGPISRSLDSGGPISRDVGVTGAEYGSGTIAEAGDISRNLGFGSLGGLPSGGDFRTERERVEGALFNRLSSRINPQFDRDVDRRIEQLANQGITEFSNPVAYQEGLRPFIEGRTDALNQAQFGAISGAGSEQSRLFSDALAARQQGATELGQQGQFANAAQAQNFGQNLQRTETGLRATELSNAARQQQFNQAMQANQFANAAQQQQFTQGMQGNQFANAAQQQANAQNIQAAEFYNQAQNQRFAQDQNILQGDLSAGSFGNTTRDAYVNELILQRNQPFNELSSFLSGAPVAGTPNFIQGPAFQMDAPDLMGLTASKWDADAQKKSGLFGAIGKLGGAAIGAAAPYIASAAGFAPLACWVAREVYGSSNPKWLQFREWMLNDAPVWFRTLYIKYGERIAAFISDKPSLKRIIKSWMDTKIEVPA